MISPSSRRVGQSFRAGARLGQLSAATGQLGPVDRPGLLDGRFPDPFGQLGEPLEEGLGDRALGGAIAVFLFGLQGGGRLSLGLENAGQAVAPG